jgi:hypothetical protein
MLELQLPPHDSDPKYCRSLNEDEKNELRIFNDQQRYNALGRGLAKQLPLTQAPIPCRSVSYSIGLFSLSLFLFCFDADITFARQINKGIYVQCSTKDMITTHKTNE